MTNHYSTYKVINIEFSNICANNIYNTTLIGNNVS